MQQEDNRVTGSATSCTTPVMQQENNSDRSRDSIYPGNQQFPDFIVIINSLHCEVRCFRGIIWIQNDLLKPLVLRFSRKDTGAKQMGRYVRKINKAEPDLVMFAGDLISSGLDHVDAITLLPRLQLSM